MPMFFFKLGERVPLVTTPVFFLVKNGITLAGDAPGLKPKPTRHFLTLRLFAQKSISSDEGMIEFHHPFQVCFERSGGFINIITVQRIFSSPISSVVPWLPSLHWS